ncbi:putative zinc-binding protein [Paraburkholderia dinghuensis]|uniref:Zinc-binding protein n=1 Tax=Paraburkholderia dinghuensis TaxID=2305225 RepID=A0A3N6N2T7_9BURK|nr:putative zinc-binding protein [Paraburkholderia dinghuensis]RQH04891.1 zinc-binding protein [Paraburkholderia dinghuensis]
MNDTSTAAVTSTPVDRSKLPLVYSCSGCSSAAQMANYVAIQLDRRNLAEMSCIAGVGGGVPKLVKVAKSGRPIVGIDGCALACVKNSLAKHGVEPVAWHELSEYEVQKVYQADFDPAQAEVVLAEVIKTVPPAAA